MCENEGIEQTEAETVTQVAEYELCTLLVPAHTGRPGFLRAIE